MHARVEDMTIYYEEHGRQGAPPLVLLHGFTHTGRISWSEQLDALGADYRLVVPDLRGRGLTDNPGGPSATNHHQFAQDLSGFCQHLGIERAAFCGYSSGAFLLLNLAIARPELVATAVLVSGGFMLPEATRAAVRGMSVLDLAHSWFGPPSDPAAPYVPEMADWHQALGADHWQYVLGDFIAFFSRADAHDFPDPERLSEIGVPVLVLSGDRDEFFPAELPLELYRRLPDAELCILPRTGHVLVEQQPDIFRTIVLEFLARRYTAV